MEDSIWTVEALRDHVIELLSAADIRYCHRFKAIEDMTETIMQAQKEAVAAALAASERASDKADRMNEKRFDSVNEFRAMMNDRERVLMPRAEVEIMVGSISRRIDDLARDVSSRQDQKRGGQTAWAYFIAGAALLIALITLFGGLK